MPFRLVPKSTTLDDLDGRIQGPTKVFEYPLLSQQRGKTTDFKFGWYIHRVHPNKSPFKFCRKGRVDVIMNCPASLSTHLRNG